MKYRVSELEGALLDAAVAKIEGLDVFLSAIHDTHFLSDRYNSGTEYQEDAVWSPSTRWQDGGPIIERERITLNPLPPEERESWAANMPAIEARSMYGSTPLLAAMRAFVASKFGAEVELP